MLDGLVTAAKAALAAGNLPAAGGTRPQILALINYRDLLTDLNTAPGTNGNPGTGGAGSPGNGNPATGGPATGITGSAGTGNAGAGRAGSGMFAFGGPVNARTIRRLACDALILPVVLGGTGEILDAGRSRRLFPPAVRRAITARDKGCAFPGCTLPAPWCEAHHIGPWATGGSTGTGNGTLLCTGHHHLIHENHWTVTMNHGTPWFTPPAYIDPDRKPQHNTYWNTALELT
jgi:hypothetical protein